MSKRRKYVEGVFRPQVVDLPPSRPQFSFAPKYVTTGIMHELHIWDAGYVSTKPDCYPCNDDLALLGLSLLGSLRGGSPAVCTPPVSLRGPPPVATTNDRVAARVGQPCRHRPRRSVVSDGAASVTSFASRQGRPGPVHAPGELWSRGPRRQQRPCLATHAWRRMELETSDA